MRAINIKRNRKEVVNLAHEILIAGSKASSVLTYGLITTAIMGQLVTVINGWPILMAVLDGDLQMISMVAIMAFALILVIGVLTLAAINDGNSSDDESSDDSYY